MGKKKSTKKGKKGSEGESPRTPPREAVPSPRTPQRNAPLPLAEPVTPTKASLNKEVLTPALKQGMDKKDITEILNISPMPSPRSAEAQRYLNEQAAQLDAAFRRMKDEEEKLEVRLEQITDQISLIDAKWAGGSIAIERGRYRQERERNLRLQQELMSQLCLIRTKSAQFAGSWAEDLIPGGLQRDMAEDWALIDAVVRCYPELEGAKKTVKSTRTEQKQEKFRKQLYDAYESATDTRAVVVYCPITHAEVENSTCAAHIVNVNVGARTAAALFGDGEDHIWNVGNGLVIHKAYEQLLDSAKAVILPASSDPSETELIFYLLTKDIGQMRMAKVWGYEALHGRRLEFKNGFRPAKKYLYFKTLMTLLRRRRADVSGHMQDLENLPDIGKRMWASPGPYLRNSILYRFSRELGCISKDEANQFWGIGASNPFKTLPIRQLKKASDIATRTANAALGIAVGEKADKEEILEDTDDRFLDE